MHCLLLCPIEIVQQEFLKHSSGFFVILSYFSEIQIFENKLQLLNGDYIKPVKQLTFFIID